MVCVGFRAEFWVVRCSPIRGHDLNGVVFRAKCVEQNALAVERRIQSCSHGWIIPFDSFSRSAFSSMRCLGPNAQGDPASLPSSITVAQISFSVTVVQSSALN